VEAVIRGLKRGFSMAGASHELTARPGMPRVVEMASETKRPLGSLISRVLGEVEKRKAAVAASKLKVEEIKKKKSKATKGDRELLASLNKYLADADELAADVRKIDSLRAQFEALGPDASEEDANRLMTRLTKRLELFGMRYRLTDLGPLTPPIQKDVGDIGSYKLFAYGRKEGFGTLEAEHIMPGAILERLIMGWDPGETVYTRGRAAETMYAQDTTLMVTKRIADIKTEIGSLRSPSDATEINNIKKIHDRALALWAKVDTQQKLTKQERETLAGLGELFNRVLARRVEVTIHARDRYIQELREGKRGDLPPTMTLASVIVQLRERLSDGKIGQAAMDQLGRAWALGKDVIVRVPDDEG
jgi:hypothetical protein